MLRIHGARRSRVYATLGAVVGIVLIAASYLFLVAPSNFPKGYVLVIGEDQSVGMLAETLERDHLIRSALLFKAAARIMRADTRVKAGTYRFDEPLGLTSVLYRFESGISGIPTHRITFPEGITVREMTERIHEVLPSFDTDTFYQEARPFEGYLFPDTYAIPEDATPTQVVELLRKTYTLKTSAYAPTPDDIVLASLLEKEARGADDRRIVAGILKKRLELGMALQVDAVFGYIRGTATYHPSGKDLELDSPYNTYKYPGLPPGPIGNPGLETIDAAQHPRETPYLYYLSDGEGVMHYARTFEEHKANKEKYLK